MEINELNFLQILDKEYEKTRSLQKVQKYNTDFAIFKKIEPIGIYSKNNFFCYKKNKTKILFCTKNCKVYLTDQDILNIILSLENNNFTNFLEKFIDLYTGVTFNFRFKIDMNIFEGIGIPYEENNDKKILLYTDNEISINEFIFIINMVLEKDRLYDLQEKTLIKYISLLKFYKYKDKKSKRFLEEIEYPCKNFNINKKTYNSLLLKEIDDKFLNKGLIFKKNMII